ncbi:MAG: hypothetical protein H0T63_10500 [Pyrinomonadaceae bacterium]|nr:hypothetical protein [Pyrinomonadaceae bacterium]
MTNRRPQTLTLIAMLLILLGLPALVSAQGGYDPWGRDRDGRRDRRDDDRDRDNRRTSDYNRNTLRGAVQRVKDRSKNFEREVDRLLDRSRVNGTRREDRINNEVKDFRQAAERLKDRVGDGRNLNRSVGEAQQLLRAADQVERMLARLRVDARGSASWREIEYDLRTIADIYGLRYNDNDGYYRRGGYDPRDRDRDRNRDRNRNGRNDDWWRRLPFPRN